MAGLGGATNSGQPPLSRDAPALTPNREQASMPERPNVTNASDTQALDRACFRNACAGARNARHTSARSDRIPVKTNRLDQLSPS